MMAGRRLGTGGLAALPAPPTRDHAIDRDAAIGELRRPGTGGAAESGLGGDDMGALEGAGIGGGATDIDDLAAFAAAQHERQAGSGDDEGAVENDAGDLAPLRKTHLEKRHLGPDRGVIDEDVEAA